MPIRPRTVSLAIQAIWLTIAMDAMMMVASYDGSDANVDALTFNGTMLLFYALVTVKISIGRNWARRAYAFLIAMELALVAAFGLSDATELEVLVTYLTLPLELWVLVQLFGLQADLWFKAIGRARFK
jgi:hypothetical protein